MTKQTKPRARSTQSTLWLVVLLVLFAFYFFYTRQAPQPGAAPPTATPTFAAAQEDAPPATSAPATLTALPASAVPTSAPDVGNATATAQPQAVPRGARATATRAPPATIDGLPTITPADLPPEARDTLALIASGGPFPFSRDGVEFQNRERLLPRQPAGYYQEYTVITPGSPDRGARRIIAGEAGERYYTDDHYDSFYVVVGYP